MPWLHVRPSRRGRGELQDSSQVRQGQGQLKGRGESGSGLCERLGSIPGPTESCQVSLSLPPQFFSTPHAFFLLFFAVPRMKLCRSFVHYC